MAPLLKIRSKRDQMSAIERRIADFILENAHLLRDYSSQQLASALKISQSSVVKFSQKLGFKGYPDLKYSVSEALARVDGVAQARVATPVADDEHDALAQRLWAGKSHAEEETRLINPSERIDAVAAAVQAASRVFCIGLGEDGITAHAFATKLAILGFASVYQPDPVLMELSAATVQAHDVLFAISEQGMQSSLESHRAPVPRAPWNGRFAHARYRQPFARTCACRACSSARTTLAPTSSRCCIKVRRRTCST